MMAEKRQTYTAEFKREAVRLVTEHGYGVAEAARNLGINTHMLRRWTHQYEAQAKGVFPGKGRLSPEYTELYRLREENKRLRREREILKKAAAFFANESSWVVISMLCCAHDSMLLLTRNYNHDMGGQR